MGGILDKLDEWLRGLLIEGITGNLSGMFDTVNTKVGEIAGEVGQTPLAWNSGVFSMIRNLSETVIVPIAGVILTFVMCYELIQLVTEKNNLHEEAFTELNEYLQLSMEQQAFSGVIGEHPLAALLVRVIPVLGHLSYSLRQYKKTMTAFAEFLQENAEIRTPAGYAAAFGQFFRENATLEESNPSWMALTNATVQYVPAIRPGNAEAQLVKRMHFVSFVGMFRADLFEGLCVGHAPRKCAVCGKWFLTTDARYAKYCDGLAPGDKRGRTCRQVGNLRGREQRELAADHPIRKIYTKRFNTITQYLGRGTLDEQTAAVMKALAKSKLEKALQDNDYAQGSYAAEMEQAALLAEAKTNRKQ